MTVEVFIRKDDAEFMKNSYARMAPTLSWEVIKVRVVDPWKLREAGLRLIRRLKPYVSLPIARRGLEGYVVCVTGEYNWLPEVGLERII